MPFKNKTKEEIREYYRQYRLKNKEKISENNKRWYEKNIDREREKAKIRSKKFRDKYDDGIHRVYYLPKHNYVGVTKNILNRFNTHKVKGKDTSNYQILFETPNREIALSVEAHLHRLGFKGKHKQNQYM